MKKEEKRTIKRFIDGEKRLFNEIKKIYDKYVKTNQTIPYMTYLNNYFSDRPNAQIMSKCKQYINSDI